MAAGGADGIDAFQKERPDCVLLDVRMPDVDGFAVCESIRALPYLTKPLKVDEFMTALESLLASPR